MKNNRIYTIAFIVIGSILVIYSQGDIKNELVLVLLGIVFLMFGLFRINSGISSKKIEDEYIKSEEEE
ncbi:MAG: hypothetical protein KJO41_07890 [Bacteroidia bacterium]|nr:hypothetical protein [Bacteroidia bacterium]NND24860.1 hypothetical protein [Flavobacteriaceae bacterium]MBT8278907.1 hypothetical protein [Bacteroidia bacterium]NNK59460.1 hypothetical protein [Flavobacteriaceae bacterium]NNL32403.1 hypothetical protein [Flavobacteriaceae bacterium]